jgi:hypothetical protein
MVEDFVLLFDTVCVACLLGGEGRLSLCVFLSVRVSGCMLDVREDSEDYRYAVCVFVCVFVCVCVCERERGLHTRACVCVVGVREDSEDYGRVNPLNPF